MTKDTGSTLRPRARLLRTLGEELISSEVVAIIELVKNSYDADADRVLVKFNGPLEKGVGSIEVIDNGHGMDLETVRTVWMEPSTPSKRGKGGSRRSDRYKRRYLGEKGIGRFASSRLAEQLEVITRRKGASTEVYGLFDWGQFDDDSKYLDEIIMLWDERNPTDIVPEGDFDCLWGSDRKLPPSRDRTHGTILRMSGLKQKWEAKHFEELRRGLARLVSPQHARAAKENKDPGFHVELDATEEYSEFSAPIEPPAILRHPHYIIKGSVNEDGIFSAKYRVLSEGADHVVKSVLARVPNRRGRYELRELASGADEGLEDSRGLSCGPIELELRIWDRDELGNVVQKTQSTITDIRTDLDAVAGVNIYRDGFRVLPYGEPRDDWLRLDLRRVQNPTMRLSNNQIYGVIQISADANPGLRDQSNREGLDENQALEDLRDVLYYALSNLEALRYGARPRSVAKSSRPVGGLFSQVDLEPLSNYISENYKGDKQVEKLVQQTERAIDTQLKEIQTVLARYQRLATLGQLIDHVLHEGRQPIAAINNETALGLLDIDHKEKYNDELVPRLQGRFNRIQKQGDVLSIAFKRMEPFGGRRRGRPVQLYLEDIIKDAFSVFEDDLRRLNVKTAIPRSQTLVRVDQAEIQEVFINLLQNSLYWIEQTNEHKREIKIGIARISPNQVDITFSDSGPGVPVANRDRIFDPYFSTKPEGVGLGLAIVGEIVTDYYSGKLELLDHGPLKGANFLISLRKRV
ncbi:sensor histidine kinase [Cerasicoccus maritimus]|uniref:sensor histidine kinase n=1 Tax=Cerasicoccus maritimus TaxID=490089 RepID=UPI0028525796|nr:ATP-binding protein [Cerasicoccus maritimus]